MDISQKRKHAWYDQQTVEKVLRFMSSQGNENKIHIEISFSYQYIGK